MNSLKVELDIREGDRIGLQRHGYGVNPKHLQNFVQIKSHYYCNLNGDMFVVNFPYDQDDPDDFVVGIQTFIDDKGGMYIVRPAGKGGCENIVYEGLLTMVWNYKVKEKESSV